MKKVLALVLSAMLVLALVGTALASAVTTGDTEVSVTGLKAGDKVNLYKVLEWSEGYGWTLTSDFASLANYAEIKAIIENTGNTISKETVEAITAIAKNKSATYNPTVASGATSVTQAVALGMYLALVEPNDPDTIYNPMIVSADLVVGGTNTVSSGSDLPTSDTASGKTVAKKETVTVEKTEPKITNDIGDEYEFTITTTVPTYAASFVDTYFKVSDTMSALLDYVDGSLKLAEGTGTASSTLPSGVTFNKIDAQNWTLTFGDSYIKNLTAPQPITITYKAKLNVDASEVPLLTSVKEEYNKITVEFPHNPKDDTDKSALKDETREYTFTIDGSLFGKDSWRTKEVVKVGLDKDGNPIESEFDYGHGDKHYALDGAVFELYLADKTTLYTNQQFNGTVTTADGGLMKIPGLDVGTYYLKEKSAPNGYIMDTNWHEVKIEANFKDVTKTEYYTVDASGNVTWSDTQTTGSKPCTYTVKVLDSYSITVDGHETSYTMTLSGPNITKVTPSESDAEIVNTKGLELPSTGGIGTTIFYVAGLMMVLGASAILVARRKADAE